MKSALKTDLERLEKLAYHRLKWGGMVARKFHRHKKALAGHPDFALLEKSYAWLFVPITLWPIDMEGLVREAMTRIEGGKRLSEEMRMLINFLPPVPDENAQAATMQHEHDVQHGIYESLILAKAKFDLMEAQLSSDPAFQADWQTIKARFKTEKFRDHKNIIRRRMVAERSMRNNMALHGYDRRPVPCGF